jgi:hypothetical protein
MGTPRPLRRLVLGLAGSLFAMALARAAVTHEFSLASLRLAGCQVRYDRIVLGEWFDPGTATVVAMEAEAALDRVADPAGGLADAACSGGRCVAKVDRALFPFRLSAAGRYQRWSLAFFPTGGGWVHSESIDTLPPQWVTDCDGSNAGKWVWVKGPVYELGVGVHLLWLHNWHGGAKLDKVALLPEGAPAPEGLGPAATPRSPALEGWAVTPALPVPGLSALREAQWPAETRDGEVSASLSFDAGGTYQPLPTGPTPLPSAACTPIPRLQLRATLRRQGDGRSPALAAPRLVCDTDPAAFAVLENAAVRAVFLRRTAGLVELVDKGAGANCLGSADGAPPFELRTLPTGAKVPQALSAASFELTAFKLHSTRLTASYALAEGIDAELSVTLNGGELAWTLAVDNRSALDLVEVVCPVIGAVRLGERGSDDLLLTPNWQGGLETADAAHAGGGSVSYPSGGAMAWLDLYEREPRHGLYLTSRDRTLLGSVLAAEPGADLDSLNLRLTRYLRIRPGQRGATPPAVIGLHAGDWHTAADAYRTWARTWMRSPQPPEWVREADAWLGLVVSADSNRVPFRRLPEYLAPMRELGTNYIQVWGQMTGGNNCDSLPYPNPVLGNLDEFTAAIRDVRRGGGHITFYVSSQFWKPAWGDATLLGSTPRALLPATCPIWPWTEWQNYAVRSYADECSGDTPFDAADQAKYGTPFSRTVPCPFTAAWSTRHLRAWCVEQYGQAYGASGIYLDETNTVTERLCFAANHGHDQHGIWGASLTRAMEQMVTDGRKRDPDWAFAMEGCNDVIGQFADVHLISPASARKAGLWGATRRFAPEVFHYTFPEYILYDGVANGVYGGLSAEEVFLNVHLHGNRYDTFGVQPAAPFVALRQRTKQLLYRARFMDDLGLAVSVPAVRAKLSVLEEKQTQAWIVNLVNPARRAGVTVRVALPAYAALAAYAFTLEGTSRPIAVSHDGADAVFIAPLSKASTVLLTARCEPLLRVPVTTLVAGDPGEIAVTVTNLNRGEAQGRLSLDCPGLDAAPALEMTLPAQGVQEVRLPVTVVKGMPTGVLNGHLSFAGRGVRVRRPLEVLVCSPFAVSGNARHGAVEIAVKNNSRSSRQGTLTVSGTLWPEPVTRDVAAAAAAVATVGFTLPPGTALTEPAEILATLLTDGQSDPHRVWLQPRLQNAGFERAGSAGLPPAWDVQNGAQIALDPVDPAEGNACLRLTGKPGAFVEAHQTLAVQPGETVTVRCRLRRSPGAARTLGPCVVLVREAGGETYLHLQRTTTAPDEQWNDFAVSVTPDPQTRATVLYLYNVDSAATAWFDAARVEE